MIVDGVNADVDSEARLIEIELECASKHLSNELLKAHTSKEDATL